MILTLDRAELQPAVASVLTPVDDPLPPSIALLDAGSTSAAPQDDEFLPNRLRFSFELPLWLPSLNGAAGVRGFKTSIDASFTKLLSFADSVVGIGGRMEAGYGRWTFVADGVYTKLISNISVGPAKVEVSSEIALGESDLFYRLGPWKLGDATAPTLSVDVGPAVRYMYLSLGMDTERGLSRHQSHNWADPLAATQIFLDFGKHWQILTRADIGGGVNADFTWSAAMLFRYRFMLCSKAGAALEVGYKAISEDFHTGSGNDKFTWDVIMHGPVIGFEVDF
jgi:hypothetical protein